MATQTPINVGRVAYVFSEKKFGTIFESTWTDPLTDETIHYVVLEGTKSHYGMYVKDSKLVIIEDTPQKRLEVKLRYGND